MNFYKKFLKPKWQHRNPNVRQLALDNLNDPAILNEMAQKDESADVRRAAIKKVNDLGVLKQIAQQDKDSNVQEFAEQRFKQLFCCQKSDCPPLKTRLIWLNKITDVELIAYIAQYGSEPELRLSALKKIEREGLLGDITINDPASEVRFAAIEKITQQSTLERVIKSTRNSDKRISRKAREKLDELIEQKEHPKKIRKECQAICTQLELLARRLTSKGSLLQPEQVSSNSSKILKQERAEWQRLQTRWQAVVEEADTEFHPRFSKGKNTIIAVFDKYQEAIKREEAMAPLRKAKQALCEQIDALLIELKKYQRLNSEEDETLNQRINALQNEWTKIVRLDDINEEEEWQARFERSNQSIQKRQQQLQSHHQIANQLEALCTKADNLIEAKKLLKSEHLNNLQANWKKISQPDDHSLSLFSELKNRFEHCLTALQTRIKEQKGRQKQAVQKFEPLLTELETTLENGELKKAISLEQKARLLLKDIELLSTSPNKTLEKRLHACTLEINKLRSWQRWGSKLERENLCSQVEGLLDTEETLEKVVKITEQAQTSWKRVGSSGYSRELWERFNKACQTIYQRYREELCVQMENLSSDSDPEKAARLIRQAQSTWKNLGSHGHSPEIWERFNKACQTAYEPCRTHFNIKSQERDRNLFEKQSLCDRLEKFTQESNWENANWKEVHRFVRDIENSWRDIGPTNRTHQKVVQRRYQAAMRILELNLDEERQRNCHHRLRIMGAVEEIARHLQEFIEAQQGAEKEDSETKKRIEYEINNAIDSVKKLQNQWQVTVPNNRSIEREFWKAFRKASDTVFNHRKQQQEEHKKELQVYMKAKIALCEQLEALATSESEEITNVHNQLKNFKEEWKNIKADWSNKGNRKKAKATEAIEDRFKKACQEIQIQYQAHLAVEQRKQIDLLKQKSAFCIEIEANKSTLLRAQNEPVWSTTVQAAWAELPKLQEAQLESAIEQRFQHALTAALADEKTGNEETLKEKETLCVRLEILAGIDSPSEATQARLAYQVARLSAAMEEGKKDLKEPLAEVEEIEQCWYLSGAVSREQTLPLEERFEKARQAFYDNDE